jgi:hypothetical protein
VGDSVICEFMLDDDPQHSLPRWAVGEIVRFEGITAAIAFKGAGLMSTKPALAECRAPQ